jgi:glucokinase
MTRYLGVDVGATTIRVVVGDDEGRIDGSHRTATPQGPPGDLVTEAVLATAREACADAGVAPETVVGVGIGAAGPLDPAEGAVVNPPNLTDGVGRIPLVEPLSRLCRTEQVTLHNDATAGAIGERFFGTETANLVYLTISTGIGAGVVVDDHLLSGWHGNAGAVGHVVVDPDGRRVCGCGGRGHWEAYCSGANVPGYARDRHDGEPTALALEDHDLDAAGVFGAAGEDEFATRVVDSVARLNAIGVSTLVRAYAPRVVVIGGGVARNHPDHVIAPVRERLPDLVDRVPDLRATAFGNEAVVRGALASAITEGRGERR